MKRAFTKKRSGEKHYGQIIELVIRRSDISISRLCKRMGVSRRSMYNWFEKDYLELHIINQVAKALNYDFSQEFPDLALNSSIKNKLKEEVKPEIPTYPNNVSFWKDKYFNLLERHSTLAIGL